MTVCSKIKTMKSQLPPSARRNKKPRMSDDFGVVIEILGKFLAPLKTL